MLRVARVSAHVTPSAVAAAAHEGPAVLYELQGHVAVPSCPLLIEQTLTFLNH